MSLKAYNYDPNYAYKDGWDKFAFRYAGLLQPNTIYSLTKELMYAALEAHLPTTEGSKVVLDVNCGTGNDFPYFLSQGWKITGTDGSAGMLNLAAETYGEAIAEAKLNLWQGMLEDWHAQDLADKRFDLIYSVTCGFSYISDAELERVNALLARLLKPSGKLVVANLNRFCLGESAYFLSRGRFGKIRRRKAELKVPVAEAEYLMRLRTPKQLRDIYAKAFEVEATKPLLAITPPYQSGYRPKPWLLSQHLSLEKWLQARSLGLGWADQVITICKPKSSGQ